MLERLLELRVLGLELRVALLDERDGELRVALLDDRELELERVVLRGLDDDRVALRVDERVPVERVELGARSCAWAACTSSPRDAEGAASAAGAKKRASVSRMGGM